MKFRNILIGFSVILLILSCENNITEPSENNKLIGSWEGVYHYSTPPWWNVHLESGETIDSGMTANTKLTFTEKSIQIVNKPHIGQYFIENEKLIQGSYADTLYQGSYIINKDTLELNVKGMSSQDYISRRVEESTTQKFIFSIEKEQLNIELYLPTLSDSLGYISYSTFLFGFSYNTKECSLYKK